MLTVRELLLLGSNYDGEKQFSNNNNFFPLQVDAFLTLLKGYRKSVLLHILIPISTFYLTLFLRYINFSKMSGRNILSVAWNLKTTS